MQPCMHVLLYVVSCLGNFLEAIVCVILCFPVILMNHEHCSLLTRVAGHIILQLMITPMVGTEYIWKGATSLTLTLTQCAGLFYGSILLLSHVLNGYSCRKGTKAIGCSNAITQYLQASWLVTFHRPARLYVGSSS